MNPRFCRRRFITAALAWVSRPLSSTSHVWLRKAWCLRPSGSWISGAPDTGPNPCSQSIRVQTTSALHAKADQFVGICHTPVQKKEAARWSLVLSEWAVTTIIIKIIQDQNSVLFNFNQVCPQFSNSCFGVTLPELLRSFRNRFRATIVRLSLLSPRDFSTSSLSKRRKSCPNLDRIHSRIVTYQGAT